MKRRHIYIFLLLFPSVCFSQWHRFHGDSRNTGLYPGGEGRGGQYGVMWTYPIKENLFSSPAIADIDLDGLPEVVMGSGSDTLYALNGEDGSVLWRYVSGDGLIYSSPVVGDIDGDLKPEVVCASYGSLRAVEGESGELLWEVPIDGGPAISPCLADLDGDGTLEVVFAGTVGTRAFSGADGAEIWSLPNYTSAYYGSTVAEDVFSDGSFEVIGFTPEPEPSVSLIKGEDGTILWTTAVPSYAGQMLTPAPAFADLDSDGTWEITGTSGCRHVYVLDALDGSLQWSHNLTSNIYSSPVVIDADGNDSLEVIVGRLNTMKLVAFSCSGEEMWQTSLQYMPVSTAAAADIDGDGVMELIQTSSNANFSSVHIINASTGDEEWSVMHTGSLSSSAAIADLDDDGYLEFVYCRDTEGIVAMRTGLEGIDPAPGKGFGLRVSPNPFTGSATISFFIGEPGNTLVEVFDISGRKVATLNDSYLNQGSGFIQWNGIGNSGETLSPGVYVCRVTSGGLEETTRFCVL